MLGDACRAGSGSFDRCRSQPQGYSDGFPRPSQYSQAPWRARRVPATLRMLSWSSLAGWLHIVSPSLASVLGYCSNPMYCSCRCRQLVTREASFYRCMPFAARNKMLAIHSFPPTSTVMLLDGKRKLPTSVESEVDSLWQAE